MAKTHSLITTVRPGHRIEVTAPELEVGRSIRVIFVDEETPPSPAPLKGRAFLDSLPRIQHTAEEWDEIDRQFQEERDSWDR